MARAFPLAERQYGTGVEGGGGMPRCTTRGPPEVGRRRAGGQIREEPSSAQKTGFLRLTSVFWGRGEGGGQRVGQIYIFLV